MSDQSFLNSMCNEIEFKLFGCYMTQKKAGWIEHKFRKAYCLWIVLEGEIKLELNKTEYTLNANDAFLFLPDYEYTAKSLYADCKFIYAVFSASIENLYPLKFFDIGGKTKYSTAKHEIDDFIDCFNTKQDLPLSSIREIAALISIICAIFSHRFKVTYSFQLPIANKNIHKKFENLLQYISDNIGEPLKVPDLAEKVFMSEKYFIKHFKDTLGVTPHQYISQLRLKYAFEYLSNAKYSVKETASLLGYSDPYAFSKSFKAYYGFSPSDV
jgi:AraC family transcriptional regulator